MRFEDVPSFNSALDEYPHHTKFHFEEKHFFLDSKILCNPTIDSNLNLDLTGGSLFL